jgi:hypothetical protein
MTPDSQKNKVIEVPDIDKLVPAMMKLLQQGRSSPSAEPQPTVEQPTPVAMAEHPAAKAVTTVLSLHSKIPFLAAGPECENNGICVLNQGSFAQAIRTAIDDYAELETGNREYFWNRPHSIG